MRAAAPSDQPPPHTHVPPAYHGHGFPPPPILSPLAERSYLQRVKYPGSEDRLNPVTPEGVDDTTLGGYPAVHGRAPAFEGSDGEPYTAAVELDRSDDGRSWGGYLVFVRWARTGSAVMGHLETGDVFTAPSEAEARAGVEALPLVRVKEILDQTIARKRSEEW